MKKVIDVIVERINANISEIHKSSPHQVHWISGPAAFTDGLKIAMKENTSELDKITILLPYSFGAMSKLYYSNYLKSQLHSSFVYHHFASISVEGHPSWVKISKKEPIFVDSDYLISK